MYKTSLENGGIQMSSDFYEIQPTATQKETWTTIAGMSGMKLRLEQATMPKSLKS